MKLNITQMERLKELVSLKIQTYNSRLLDIVLNCKHPQNLLSVGNKFSPTAKEDIVDLESFRSALAKTLDDIKVSQEARVEDAIHPHEIVLISQELDKLIDGQDWY